MKRVILAILVLSLCVSMLPISENHVQAATYDAAVVVDLALSKVSTSFANGYCLRFVKEMFAAAYGFTSTACCAYKYGSSYIDSTSRTGIPLGASVFFSGSTKTCSTCGNKCGHIGIYVGNDYVVHGWGGKIVKYKIDRIINAGYPYRGWGWHGNVALSSDVPVESAPSNSVNPDDYPFPTRDIYYRSGISVFTGNDVKWIQAVLYQLGYSIVIDGSFGPASKTVVQQFQSDNGLTVDGSVGPATRSKLMERWNSMKNGNISISLHGWVSDSEYGDTPDKYIARNRVYLCYELIESNTGQPINELVSKNYSVTLTLYGLDGSVAYTNQVTNDDESWISLPFYQEGRYTGTIAVTGDINVTVNVSFSVEYDSSVSSSLSSISLNLNGTNSRTTTITVSGGYPGEYFMRYAWDDTSVASASWGEWNGSSIPITVTGKKVGSTNLIISLYEDYTEEQRKLTSITIPVTVTANTYTITYNANGGSGAPSSQTKYYGTDITLSSTVPTRSGYTFLGWSTSSTATSATYQPGSTFSANANTTLYAVWKANPTYSITYNANGGSGAPSTQTGSTNYTISSTVPVRFGYTFLGWSTNSSATASTYEAGDTVAISGNLTLYAVWKSATTLSLNTSYTAGIDFANQEVYYAFTPSSSGTYTFESTGSLDSKIYVYNTSGTELGNDDDSSDEGYNFKLTMSLTGGTKYFVKVRAYSNDTGTISFLTTGKYTVAYDANGGSNAPANQTKTHGTTLTLSTAVPSRSGYTFKGWATSSTATTAAYQPGGTYTYNSNVTLYAVWETAAAALTVDSHNNAVISSQADVQYFTYTPSQSGDYVIYSTSSEDTFVLLYYYSGSYITSDDNSGEGNNFRLSIYLNAGVTYQFCVGYSETTKTGTIPFAFGRVYRVSYDSNGSSETLISQGKPFGIPITLSGGPSRSGYNFLGWSASPSATSATYQPGSQYTADADITLYAVWEPLPTALSVNSSNNAVIAEGGEMKYYTYTPSTDGKYVIYSTGSVDTKVYLYDASGNQLSSNDDGGEGNNFRLEYTLTAGTQYKYGVRYFSSSTTGTIPFTFGRVYTVTYDANGGTGAPASQKKDYAADILLSSTVPERTGYTFTGWTTDPSAASADYEPGDTFEEDDNVCLYAVWKRGCAGDHSYSYAVTKAPTVSTTGTLTGTCSNCSGTTTVTLPKLTTTDYNYTVKTAATCTANGTGTYTWKTTTYGTFSFDVAITKTGHSYDEGVITTTATCTQNGVKTYTCSGCGETYTERISATGHGYSYAVTKAPAASATGTLTGTCSKCSGTTTVTLPKLTTTDYNYTVKTAATCTNNGTGTYTWKTTTYGTFSFDVVITKTGHSFDDGVITTAATCTANGVRTFTCSSCGDVYTQEIPSVGHQYQNGSCLICGLSGKRTVLNATVTSFGEMDAAITLHLYREGTDTAAHIAQITDGRFTVPDLLPGIYTAVFSKENHVARSYEVNCNDTVVDLDAKIHLIGDVTGDGRVNVGDVSRIYAYARKNGTLGDYEFLCADVTGDGRVNVGDVSRVYGHSRKTSLLW